MTTPSRLLVPASKFPHDGAYSAQVLGFSVNLDSGRGLLTTRHRRLGPVVIDALSLEIPHLAFPFDISGGAARFKKRRCSLVQLALHVDAIDLTACLSEPALREQGFTRLSATIQDGTILLAGRVAMGKYSADFTLRASPVVQGGRNVDLLFYDPRVYGYLPVPGALLPRYLWRALRWPAWFTERAAAWQLRPIDAFAREMLPRGGWKIPAMHTLRTPSVAAHQGQLYVACGEAEQPAVPGASVPAEALQAADGIALNRAAEAALHDGQLEGAYELLRRAVDDGQGGAWACARLLQVGAALPQLAADTRHYAQQFLERDQHTTHARLTLAALAMHEGNDAAAAVHMAALASKAQQHQHIHDAAAAWLLQSRLQADIDVESALQAGSAAVGLTPKQPEAHWHMYRLHRKCGRLEQATLAAEHWAHCCDQTPAQAATFCELGAFFCDSVQDYVKARRMYEHALTRAPEDPTALAGLAELHLKRGDTPQALTFFARLATQWEEAGDNAQAVACHLRLAHIWQHQMDDIDASAARYKKAIALAPTCMQALVAVADFARHAERHDEALAHYQTIIAADTAAIVDAPPAAVHAYEHAITLLQQTSDPAQHATLQLAYLDRLCLLAPTHPQAATMRLDLLRAQRIYGRLAQALKAQAHATDDASAACELLLEAAHLAQDHLQDPALLRDLLTRLCARQPAHAEALAMLLPLLQSASEWQITADLLTAAVAAEAPSGTEQSDQPDESVAPSAHEANAHAAAARAQHLVALAHAQAELQKPTAEQVATLERALACKPHDLAAAQALVNTHMAHAAHDPAALAAAYETLASAQPEPQDQGHAWMAAASHHPNPLQAVAAAERAVGLMPAQAAPHLLRITALDALGDADAVQQAFSQAAQKLTDEAQLAELWARQAAWAQLTYDTALQLQALQALAEADRLTLEQAVDLANALQATGQTDRAVDWLVQWADTGTPLCPSEALLLAAAMLQKALCHDRAHALLERVLRHAPEFARRAAQALEHMAQTTQNDTWLAQAWRAQIVTAPNAALRALKQARLLLWQTDNRDPERIVTARALLLTQPCHPLACHVLAHHHDGEKAWLQGLEIRLAMLSAPPEPPDADKRRAAYTQAAAVAADLRPQLLAILHAGWSTEFAGMELPIQPLVDTLTEQQRWDDLLALRQEQHRQDPEHLPWQRAIATLLQDRFDRHDEARSMWRAICTVDPSDAESLQQWLQSAERAQDLPALAAAHAALAHQKSDPQDAWHHALKATQLRLEDLNDPQAARELLHGALAMLPSPQDEATAQLTARLLQLRMYAEVLALAPTGWEHSRQSAAWTERIEQALQGLGRPFDHIAFVLTQTPLGTYEAATAATTLVRLLAACPSAYVPAQQSITAQAHAFCAQYQSTIDPERALTHCHAATAHHPAPQTLLALHEDLLMRTHRFAEAAELQLTEAQRQSPGPQARAHYEKLATLCEQHLQDPTRARWAIEQAVQQAPRDAKLLRRLLAMIPIPKERGHFVATAEALIAISPDAQQDVTLLRQLAEVCIEIDRPRAVALLRRAMTLTPSDRDLRNQWQALQGALAGAEAPAATEPRSEAIASAKAATRTEGTRANQAAANTDTPTTPPPWPTRAAPPATRVDPVLQNITAWQAAAARDPHNRAIRERYAAACAQSPAHHCKASAIYLDLLQHDCTQTPWLRILARLEGAQGNQAASYAFYAALLAIQPADPEAHRFVQACRQLRPRLPARPFGNADWDNIRENFQPHPKHSTAADPQTPTIEPRALSAIAPQSPKVAPLVALLQHVGTQVPKMALWPAGGRQCAMAKEGNTLMVGAALYNDMPNSAGLFLGLRAILQAHDTDIHPAHGNNAAIILAADVAEATEALCAAQGMVMSPQASRAALINKTPELQDLLRFSQSSLYLKLRCDAVTAKSA